MSSEKERAKNPLEELIEMLTAVNEAVGGNVKEQTPPPTSPVGYESLIPDSVMQKVQDVKKAVDELNKETAKMCATMLAKDHKNSYAQFQMVMFMDSHRDAIEAVNLLTKIHELDKPMIDECAKEHGMPTEMFIHSYLARKAMEL